jgi:hypothetical protein
MNVNLFREYKRIFVLGLLFESGNVFAQDEPSWNDPPVTGRSQPVYIVDATIDGIQIDITNDWIGIFDDTLIVGKDQVDGLPAINPITEMIHCQAEEPDFQCYSRFGMQVPIRTLMQIL